MTVPFLVFDLEFTAWPGSRDRCWQGPGEHREIVQIGAVAVDPQTFGETAALSILVKPRINPRLSDYFIALTGITQGDVDGEGVDIVEALARFAAFAGSTAAVLSNGPDQTVIFENCDLAGCPCPIGRHRFHNVGPLLARACGRTQPVSSGELPDAFPAVPRLSAHNALADARMVARALAAVRDGGWAIPGLDPAPA